MRRPRRVLRRALASIAVGLLATVSVAWGLALFPPEEGWVRETYHADGWTADRHVFEVEVVVFRTPGMTRRCWLTFAHERVSYDLSFERVIAGAAPPGSREIDHNPGVALRPAVAWGQAAELQQRPREDAGDGCEGAVGWPCPAACYEFDEATIAPGSPVWRAQVRGGIVVEPSGLPPTGLWDVRVLPLRPVWLGALMDVGAYALACFGALSLLAAARGWRRRRSQKCPECGYTLSGLPRGGPCPECGRASGH